MPLWLDIDGLRVIHACWDEKALGTVGHGLNKHGGVTNEFLYSACQKGGELFAPIEVLLKGKEGALPEGMSFLEADKHVPTIIRTRWYLPTEGQTYRTYAFQIDEIPCDEPLAPRVIEDAAPYPPTNKPLFIGHYWIPAPSPALLAEDGACVDYGVAKGGFLCAYRWSGETKLSNQNFAGA